MVEQRLTILAAKAIDGGDDMVADARKRYRDAFPGRGARRMTHLGILVDLCAREMEPQEATPVVYASAFAESCSLEEFIDSFPMASPLLFQTSIHPSAVEQSFISRQRPVSRFYPVTSSTNLAGKALEEALLHDAAETIVLGGEERGTWLRPFGLASDASFAFAMKLGRDGGAEEIGTLRFEADVSAVKAPGVELPELWKCVAERAPLSVPMYGLGGWLRMEWR